MFSAAELAQGLLEGKGMGLATPAENHGYPGPRHVLADQLHLSPDQKAKTEALVTATKAKAIPQTKLLLADEAALESVSSANRQTWRT